MRGDGEYHRIHVTRVRSRKNPTEFRSGVTSQSVLYGLFVRGSSEIQVRNKKRDIGPCSDDGSIAIAWIAIHKPNVVIGITSGAYCPVATVAQDPQGPGPSYMTISFSIWPATAASILISAIDARAHGGSHLFFS